MLHRESEVDRMQVIVPQQFPAFNPRKSQDVASICVPWVVQGELV